MFSHRGAKGCKGRIATNRQATKEVLTTRYAREYRERVSNLTAPEERQHVAPGVNPGKYKNRILPALGFVEP